MVLQHVCPLLMTMEMRRDRLLSVLTPLPMVVEVVVVDRRVTCAVFAEGRAVCDAVSARVCGTAAGLVRRLTGKSTRRSVVLEDDAEM